MMKKKCLLHERIEFKKHMKNILFTLHIRVMVEIFYANIWKSSNIIHTVEYKLIWEKYLDSAEGLQPGAPFQSLANIPMYSKHINVSGTTYDDKKNDTCWCGKVLFFYFLFFGFICRFNILIPYICDQKHVEINRGNWKNRWLIVSYL